MERERERERERGSRKTDGEREQRQRERDEERGRGGGRNDWHLGLPSVHRVGIVRRIPRLLGRVMTQAFFVQPGSQKSKHQL